MSPLPLGMLASGIRASAPPPIDAVSSILGTALWLRGRDLGANGASITAWPDASGKQRPMLAAATVPVVLTGDTATGSKVADYSAGGHWIMRSLVTASSMWDSSYDPRTCLGIPFGSGYWHSASNVAPHWYKEQTATARVVTGYTIGVIGGAGPNTFKFQGSNDDTNWTDLDSRSGITWSGNETKSWTFSNANAYLYHRIYVSVTNGDGYQRWFTVNIQGLDLVPSGDGHLLMVVKSDTGIGGSNGAWEFGNPSQSSHFGYGGVIYEGAGLSGARREIYPSMNTDAYRIYEVKVSGTTSTVLLDGVVQHTATVSPYWRPGAVLLGRNNASNNFDGKIAELLWLDHAATGLEYSNILKYFIAEHGVFNLYAPTVGFTPTAVTASSDQAGYEAAKAIDGYAPTPRWASSSTSVPQWLAIDIGTAKSPSWYEWVPGEYPSSQDPYTWTLQGSNDNFATAGVVLDTRTGVAPQGVALSLRLPAGLPAYRYYRLHVTQVNGGGLTSVADFSVGSGLPPTWLFGRRPPSSTVTGTFSVSVDFTALADGYITHLVYPRATGTGAAKLYLSTTAGVLLASATDPNQAIRPPSVAVPIAVSSPLAVAAGTTLRVSTYLSGNCWSYAGSIATPIQTGDLVTVANSPRYDTVDTNNPSNAGGAWYGSGVIFVRAI